MPEPQAARNVDPQSAATTIAEIVIDIEARLAPARRWSFAQVVAAVAIAHPDPTLALARVRYAPRHRRGRAAFDLVEPVRAALEVSARIGAAA